MATAGALRCCWQILRLLEYWRCSGTSARHPGTCARAHERYPLNRWPGSIKPCCSADVAVSASYRPAGAGVIKLRLPNEGLRSPSHISAPCTQRTRHCRLDPLQRFAIWASKPSFCFSFLLHPRCLQQLGLPEISHYSWMVW